MRDSLISLQHRPRGTLPCFESSYDSMAPMLPLQRWELGLEQLLHASTPLDVPLDAEMLGWKAWALNYLMRCLDRPRMHLGWHWHCLMDDALLWGLVNDGCHWDDMGGMTHDSLMLVLSLDGATLVLHALERWHRPPFGWYDGGRGAFWRCTHTLCGFLGVRSTPGPLPHSMSYWPFQRVMSWWRSFFSYTCGLFLTYCYILEISQGWLVTFDLVEHSSKLVLGILLVELVNWDLVAFI